MLAPRVAIQWQQVNSECSNGNASRDALPALLHVHTHSRPADVVIVGLQSPQLRCSDARPDEQRDDRGEHDGPERQDDAASRATR